MKRSKKKNKGRKTVDQNTLFVSIQENFSAIKDPRIERTKLHLLEDIIALTICAVIAGCESWVDVENYGKNKEEWLKTLLKLPNGIPSHDTIGRVFSLLDPESFQECFSSWMKSLVNNAKGIIAVDGKSVKGSAGACKGKKAIHMISAFACSNNLVIGQVKTEDKSNEITAIPELLRVLDLNGCVVTIDAMGCQKTIAKQITEQGGDYVFGLKGNQGNLHKEVKELFAECQKEDFKACSSSYHREEEKNHGRTEIREYWTVTEMPLIVDAEMIWRKERWKGLKIIGMVKSQRTIRGKTSTETRYYIGSLKNDAKAFAEAVRKHWYIENKLHWMLDISFREDECQVRNRNAAENFSTIRRIALNLLKQEKTAKGGVKAKRLQTGWNNDYLLKVLANGF